VTEQHVRRMLVKLKEAGDGSVINGPRGRPSNRKLSPDLREKAVRILSQEVYRGFGPTLASEHLLKDDGQALSHDTIRRMFENEPGVLIFENAERSPSRRRRTSRIPESVAERVYCRLSTRH